MQQRERETEKESLKSLAFLPFIKKIFRQLRQPIPENLWPYPNFYFADVPMKKTKNKSFTPFQSTFGTPSKKNVCFDKKFFVRNVQVTYSECCYPPDFNTNNKGEKIIKLIIFPNVLHVCNRVEGGGLKKVPVNNWLSPQRRPQSPTTCWIEHDWGK